MLAMAGKLVTWLHASALDWDLPRASLLQAALVVDGVGMSVDKVPMGTQNYTRTQ